MSQIDQNWTYLILMNASIKDSTVQECFILVDFILKLKISLNVYQYFLFEWKETK